MYQIASQRISISKIFPEEHATETPQRRASFAVLMGAMAPILLLYTISLGPLYHKILRPSLIFYHRKHLSTITFQLLLDNSLRTLACRGFSVIWSLSQFLKLIALDPVIEKRTEANNYASKAIIVPSKLLINF